MKTVLFTRISLISEGHREHFASAFLDIELPCTPVAGMEISHSAWKDGRKIHNVTIQIEPEGQCSLFVYMGEIVRSTFKEAQLEAEGHKGHGWRVTMMG